MQTIFSVLICNKVSILGYHLISVGTGVQKGATKFLYIAYALVWHRAPFDATTKFLMMRRNILTPLRTQRNVYGGAWS